MGCGSSAKSHEQVSTVEAPNSGVEDVACVFTTASHELKEKETQHSTERTIPTSTSATESNAILESDMVVVAPGSIQSADSQEQLSRRRTIQGVPVPDRYLRRRSTIKDTAMRAISLEQLKSLGQFVEHVLAERNVLDSSRDSPGFNKRIEWKAANMYHVNEHFVLPLSKPFICSFVELVCETSEQPPIWFVSHWWGGAMSETLELLGWHAQCHLLQVDTTYWVCTFANNQHNVAGEIGGGVMNTPFVRAIASPPCIGIVLLLDAEVTPMQRIWCVLENYVGTTAFQNKKYELCAIIPEGSQWHGLEGAQQPVQRGPALLMDTGPRCLQEACEPEGGVFPHAVARAGAHVDVAQAKASNEDDRKNILHIMAGSTDLSVDPPVQCDGYRSTNRALREFFAAQAMCVAIQDGEHSRLFSLVEDFPAKVNERMPDYTTPLIKAVLRRDVASAHALLSARADPELDGTEARAPPLWFAAREDAPEIVSLLVDARACVNALSGNGISPVLAASFTNARDSVRALLDAEGDVNFARSGDGLTPILAASQNAAHDCLRVLIEFRGNVNSRTSDKGHTPALLASGINSYICLQFLLDAHADVNVPTTDVGITPIFQAASVNAIECLRLLISARSALNCAACGFTPVAIANMQGHQAAVELLLQPLRALEEQEHEETNTTTDVIPHDVNFVDTDGDDIRFKIQGGYLQEFVNTECERILWLQVDLMKGEIRTPKGMSMVTGQAESLAKLKHLCKHCQTVWVEPCDPFGHTGS